MIEKLKEVKDGLNKDINALKSNKKIDIDRDEIKKRLDEAHEKQQKQIDALKETAKIQQEKKNSDYHAMVKLYIVSGTKRERVGKLGAYFGHKEGKQTLKVINKDKDVIFEEYKPDWQNSYRYTDKNTLETNIAQLKETIKRFQNKEILEKKDEKGMVYYEEDYIAMLRKAEQEYSILVLGSEGTYSESVNGLEEYSFDIVGFFKIPMFYYTSKSIMGLPPATKIVVGQYLDEILNKNYKADEERAQKIIMTLLVLGFVVALLGTVYTLYHFAEPMVELAKSNAQMATHMASNINFTDTLNNIGNKIDVTNNLLDTGKEVTQNLTTKVR